MTEQVPNVGLRRFQVGDRVRIARLSDSMTSRGIIGHVGVIEEFDADAWPLIANYYMKCTEPVGCHHYVHDEELDPA